MALQQAALDQLGEVERRYIFDEPEEIRAFLGRHPYLIDILVSARDPIERSFGKRASVQLWFYVDPEEEADDAESLGAIISSSLPLDDARQALRTFENLWWLDHISRSDARLTFDIHVP